MPQSRGVCTRVHALQMMTHLQEVPWKQIYLRLLNTKFKISTEFFLSEKKKRISVIVGWHTRTQGKKNQTLSQLNIVKVACKHC